MYGDLNLSDYKPGQPLSKEQMDAIIDMDNANNIPDDVNDQFNAQLDSHLKGELAPGTQTAQDTGCRWCRNSRCREGRSPRQSKVRGDIQTAESQKMHLIQDGDKIDQKTKQRFSKNLH